MVLERILLQTIKFDLQVDHPYQFLLKYAKCLKGMSLKYVLITFLLITFTSYNCMYFYLTGDKAKLTKMVQMAWTFVNDR